ncbi:hypothetical protein Cs308_0514 [Candidatus Chlamydia sanziniae]|uniref:Uncharacterized protein n=1 Tax=Candidatus Chlamydia sanziniae TaxID=1806891 RepID=A0A1A9HXC0_9CHLA|nr:hypothetical protein Cs308_0514 [Candidatus Chlamydia sanziniae]
MKNGEEKSTREIKKVIFFFFVFFVFIQINMLINKEVGCYNKRKKSPILLIYSKKMVA